MSGTTLVGTGSVGPGSIGLVPLAAVVGLVAATAVAVRRATEAGRARVVLERLDPDGDSAAPPVWFRHAVREAGLAVDADRAWMATTTACVLIALVVLWRWPQVAVAGAALGVVVDSARRRGLRRQQRRTYDATLIGVIDGLVARLSTGTSLALAFEEGASHRSPVGADVAEVVRRHRHGQPLQTAIDHWAVARGTDGVRLLADALAIAGRSGGSQRAALVGVQTTLRSREALAREVRALASQARTSGVVLAITPAAFAAAVALVDEQVAAFFSTPVGWGCLLGGVVLDGIGALWMNRLTEVHS